MLKEIVEKLDSIEVTGSSPAGGWWINFNVETEKVWGGVNPWNQPITVEWVKGLGDKKYKEEFWDAILAKDADKASSYSGVVVKSIK